MQRPYTNASDRPISIGGKRIAPGQTRSVEETLIPGWERPGLEPKAPSDPVLELLDNSVKDIVPRLPELSDDEFDRIRQAEADGKSRKSLAEAFGEETLRRAELAAAADGEQGRDE